MALIPQYEYNNGSVEFTVVEPHVLNVANKGGTEFLNFDTLDYPVLVAEYYAGYQKMMNAP